MGKSSKMTALIFLGVINACSSDPETVLRKNTETLLKSNLNDASSYEYVSINDLDSLSAADTLILFYETSIQPFRESRLNLYDSRSRLLIALLENCAYNIDCDDEEIRQVEVELRADSLAIKNYSDQMDSIFAWIETPEWRQNMVGYKALFQYRANNAAGAKELREMRIYADKDFNLYDRFITITP
jgi:hypothetical protein